MKAIILIDDRLDEVAALETFLADRLEPEGFEVLGYTDPVQAVKALTARPDVEPHVLVIDYRMPDCDVAESAMMPFREQWRECKILLLTGQASLSEVGDLSRRGLIDDVLDKAGTPDDVAAKVRGLLRRRKTDLLPKVEKWLRASPRRDEPRFVLADAEGETRISAMDMVRELREGTKLGDRMLDAAMRIIERTLEQASETADQIDDSE